MGSKVSVIQELGGLSKGVTMSLVFRTQQFTLPSANKAEVLLKNLG